MHEMPICELFDFVTFHNFLIFLVFFSTLLFTPCNHRLFYITPSKTAAAAPPPSRVKGGNFQCSCS